MTSRKKIFDITPPQKSMPLEQHAESHVVKESVKKKLEKPRSLLVRNKNWRLVPLFTALVILLALASGYFLIPSKADVEIWPQKKDIAETAQVIVSAVRKGANFVPGEIFKAEKVVSQNFQVQGKKLKETKAQGIIRVYNNYSVSSQTLVALTRFVSDDGKLFRTPKKIVIPGGQYEGGRLVAGFVDIEVAADQPGAEYNINASIFSIPGFAGTPKYTAFYGKSFEPMKGGSKQTVPYLSKEDLDKAKEVLVKIALAESEVSLRDLIASRGYLLIDRAISNKTDEFKTSAEAGQEIESFSAQIKATAKAVAFREQDLREFSITYLQAKLLPEEKLIGSLLKTDYSPEAADAAKDEITLKLTISARSHAAPEEIQVKEMIKNRSIEEVENILKGIPQIERAEVKFWPFWVSLAPEDQGRIGIVLRLD